MTDGSLPSDDGPNAQLDPLDEVADAAPPEVTEDLEDRLAIGGLFDDLVHEHRIEGIGELWVAEVERMCRIVANRYAPQTYSGTAKWDDAAREDLLQDVVEHLLRKRQIEYICTVAHDLDSIRRLLWRQTKFAVSSRRRSRRTVVDNLVDRAVQALVAPNYELSTDADGEAWCRTDGRSPGSPPDSLQRHRLVTRLKELPRLPGESSERASPVWARAELEAAVADIAATYPSVTRGLLDELFGEALTFLVPSELEANEEHFGLKSSPGPEEAKVMKETVDQAVTALSAVERRVLIGKLRGDSDASLARLLQISRPTVDKYKREAFAQLQVALADVGNVSDDALMDALIVALATTEGTP
ncbi:helix-turn-helix transcriptional regulator [Mycolicibacterium sp. XJ879]